MQSNANIATARQATVGNENKSKAETFTTEKKTANYLLDAMLSFIGSHYFR